MNENISIAITDGIASTIVQKLQGIASGARDASSAVDQLQKSINSVSASGLNTATNALNKVTDAQNSLTQAQAQASASADANNQAQARLTSSLNMVQTSAQSLSTSIGMLATVTNRLSTAATTSSSAVRNQATDIGTLLGKIDPTVAALDRLDTMEQQLTAHMKAGKIDTSTYADYKNKLDAARASVGNLSDATAKGTTVTAGMTREFIVLGHEALTGNFSRIPGSLLVLTERLNLTGGALSLLLNPITLVVAGIVALGAAAVVSEINLRTLNGELAEFQATGRSNINATMIGQLTQQLEQLPGVGKTAANEIIKSFADVRGVGATNIVAATKIVGDLGVALGTTTPKAADILAKALDDPKKGIVDLDRQLGLFTQGNMATVKALTDTGKTAQAQKLIIDLLTKSIGGLEQDGLTPVQKAVNNLGNAWNNLTRSQAGGSSFFNDANTLLAEFLESLTKILTSLSDFKTPQWLNDLTDDFKSLMPSASQTQTAIDFLTKSLQELGTDALVPAQKFTQAQTSILQSMNKTFDDSQNTVINLSKIIANDFDDALTFVNKSTGDLGDSWGILVKDLSDNSVFGPLITWLDNLLDSLSNVFSSITNFKPPAWLSSLSSDASSVFDSIFPVTKSAGSAPAGTGSPSTATAAAAKFTPPTGAQFGQTTAKKVKDSGINSDKGVGQAATRAAALAKINLQLDNQAKLMELVGTDQQKANQFDTIQESLTGRKITLNDTEIASIKAKIAANIQANAVSQQQAAIYDQIRQPQITYSSFLTAGLKLLASGKITQDEYNKSLLATSQAFANAQDPLRQNIKDMQDQLALSTMTTDQAALAAASQKIKNDLLKTGVDLNNTNNQSILESVKTLTEQNAQLQLNNKVQAEYNKLYDASTGAITAATVQTIALNKAYAAGIVTLDQYNVGLTNINLAANDAKNNTQVLGEYTKIYNDTAGAAKNITDQVLALSAAQQTGLVSAEQYSIRLNNIALAALDLKLKMPDATFGDAITAGLGKLQAGYTGILPGLSASFGDFFKSISDGFADSIGKAITQADNLHDALVQVAQQAVGALISSLIKVGLQYVINGALSSASLATTTTASVSAAAATATAWAPAAAAVSLATEGSNAIPAAAALGSVNFLAAALAKTGAAGLQTGGYTGDAPTNQVTNFVHGQEFVVNAAGTKANRSLLEAINSGAKIQGIAPVQTSSKGGSAGTNLNVAISNQIPDAQYDVRQLNSGDVEIIARRVSRQESDKSVAANLSNRNSKTSKSLAQNTKTVRAYNN